MRTARDRRQGTMIIGLIVAVLALSGCLTLETRFDIRADGTADLGVTMLIDVKKIRALGEMFGEDMSELDELTGEELIEEFGEGENPCDGLADSFGGRVESRAVVDGDRRGVTCTVAGVPIEELSGEAFEDGSKFAIVQDDQGTSVELVFPAGDLTAESDEFGAMLGLTFEELFDIRFVVSAPGTLVEHNATSVSGSTVTWQLSPDAGFIQGEDAVMTARWSGFAASTSDDGGLSVVVIAAIIAGLIIVVGAVMLILRRRSSTPDPSDTDIDDGAPTAPPPPPPTETPPPPPPPSTLPPPPSG